MTQSTIRIRYPNERPKRAWGSRIARALSALTVLVIIVLAGLWFLTHWAEETIRERIDEHAKRANVVVSVEEVVVNFSSPIGLRGVTVRDPETQEPLITLERITTDLTLKRAIQGARRPSVIHVHGAIVDGKAHKRLKEAWNAYRKTRSSQPPSSRRERPHIDCTACRVLLPITRFGTPTVLENIEARLIPTTGEPGEWSLEAQADTDQGQQVKASGHWRPTSSNHELGLSVSPYLELQGMLPAGVGSDADASVRVQVAGLYYRHGEIIRVRGISAEVHNAENIRVSVGTLAIHQDKFAPALDSAFDLRLNDIELNTRTHSATIGHATASLLPDEAGSIMERLYLLRAGKIHAREVQGIRFARVQQLTVRMRGIRLNEPWWGLESVDVMQAHAQMPLPTSRQSAGIPYYDEIQRFLLGKQINTGPGGPPTNTVPAGRTASIATRDMPSIQIQNSSITLLSTETALPVIELDRLGGGINPDEIPDRLHIRLGGQLQDVITGEHSPFAVDMSVSNGGGLHRAHVKLAGSKLAVYVAQQVSDSVRLTDSSNLSIDLEITPMADTHGFNVAGKVAMREMGFMAPRIHNSPVDGLQVTAELHGSIDFETHTLVLNAPLIELADGKAALQLTSIIDQLDHDLPRLNVKLKIPRQPCQNLLDAIPPTLIQRLDGLRVSGTAAAHVQFEVDLEKPRAFRHDIDVDLGSCRPRNYGKAAVTRLNRNFVHEVVEKGNATGILVGPGTEHYRPLNEIPRFIQMGALWTEDHSFFSHQGFRPSLIRRAIILNLERGRYVYGGSTISQQLVKNLYLSREKTLSRKLEEAIIVWLMERAVTKKRILELYLNCIEYGPDLYGIHNASQRYFGKDVTTLSPLEGAFLMGLKPYPWAGWKQYERGFLNKWWIRRVRKILEGMAKKGWIRPDELEASRPFQLMFSAQDALDSLEGDETDTALPRMPSDG